MAKEIRDIEPFFGWLEWYSGEKDEYSPFYEVEHNLFYYDRSINHIPAHPLWDDIGSESLLIKILYADYRTGYAVVEMFGEWNDLFENDFRLLAENCLTYLVDRGINRFILICENVFHAYFESDDYYQAMQDELEDGWICILQARDSVKEEMEAYGISPYFYWNGMLDEVPWRRFKPFQLYHMVENRMRKVLE